MGLSDHFPCSGILKYMSDRDWLLGVCYLRVLCDIRQKIKYHGHTYQNPNGQP